MPTKIRLGTDGWRGIIADDFTLENVRLCTQGVAAYLKTTGRIQGGIVVGYDTRFASEAFAAAAAEVLAGNGITAHLCRQPAPTPVVSYAITDLNAAGAVIITASHNPASYSGYKFRPAYGGAASDEVLSSVQAAIDRAVAGDPPVQRAALDEAIADGRIKQLEARPPYFAALRRLVNLEAILDSSLRVLVDPMYGAGMGYLPALLDGGRIWVREIHGERNPIFPGMRAPEPAPENLSRLRRTVHVESVDVGLATDGDADRLALVDETGRSVENFEVYPLLLYYLLELLGQRGPVVKTVATSSLVDRIAERYGVPVHTVGVGFKHVAPAMIETGAILGGEESGGVCFWRPYPGTGRNSLGFACHRHAREDRQTTFPSAGRPSPRVRQALLPPGRPGVRWPATGSRAAVYPGSASGPGRRIGSDRCAHRRWPEAGARGRQLVVVAIVRDRAHRACGSGVGIRGSYESNHRRGCPTARARRMIDTHAHLDLEHFEADRDQVIRRAVETGVNAIINVGIDVASSRESVRMADEWPAVWAAVGVNPGDAQKLTEGSLSELRELAAHPKVVAIGEIGLDYYWDASPRGVQAAAFERQLQLAAEVKKPVIIHDREAHHDVMAILEPWLGQVRAVLHCFSGDLAMAHRAVELGIYIGVDGPVTFRNAGDLPDIVRAVPLDSLLLETDSPYLTPHPYRGKRNEPGHVMLIARTVADLKGVTLARVDEVTTGNARALFGLQ